MELLKTHQITRLGIKDVHQPHLTKKLFARLVQWGWYDGLGSPLAWNHFNKKPKQQNSQRKFIPNRPQRLSFREA